MITSLNIKGTLFDLTSPVVMGILNVTPDSFYDGGKWQSMDQLLVRAQQIVEEGGHIMDVGGYSSRPGAAEVSENEELQRVVPVVSELKKSFPHMLISIDTFRRKVAEQCVEAGADIVNDISAGELDETMFDFIIDSKVPYCMMHMRGTPATMSSLVQYDHLVNDVLQYFTQKIHYLHERGVSDLIVDPGFGFAKTLDQNYELLKHLNAFTALGKPILVGISRKSMVRNKLNVGLNDSLTGTIALNMFSLQKGAKILRVHDVKEAVQCVMLHNHLV